MLLLISNLFKVLIALIHSGMDFIFDITELH